jgi:heme-degrading monooxygenase HmoA
MEKVKLRISYYADNTNPRVIVHYWDSEEKIWENDSLLSRADFKSRGQALNYIEDLKQLDGFEVVNVDVY